MYRIWSMGIVDYKHCYEVDKMRAVLYTRVSTSMQAIEGASLELQKEKLNAYCTLKEWEIVNMYEDAGLSGKNINRPAYKQMMQDAQAKKFDVIVIYKLDRLTRSVKDFHELAENLDKLNISLVSITQNLDTSNPIGRLLRNILVDFANFEREMIVERVTDAKYNLAEKGQWLGGNIPYGYKVINKKLILVEDEANIVRKIYNDYIKGSSTRKLMLKYNLNKGLIAIILRNPIYTGLIAYGKTNQTNKNKKQNKNIDEWIIAQGNHEPIITKELWDKVQEIKSKNYRIPSSNIINEQIFENICYCACGKKLYYYKNKRENKIYKYYRCNSSNKITKGCKFSISSDDIEKRIIKKLLNISNQKTFWDEVEKKINTGHENNSKQELKKLNTEYEKNKKTVANLILHMGSESGQEIAQYITPQIKKLEIRQNELLKLIEDKENENIKVVNLESTKQILTDYMEYWKDMSINEKRSAIKILVKKMIISKNRIVITLNQSDMPDIIC